MGIGVMLTMYVIKEHVLLVLLMKRFFFSCKAEYEISVVLLKYYVNCNLLNGKG